MTRPPAATAATGAATASRSASAWSVRPKACRCRLKSSPGNRTDVTTVEEIVTVMENKYGQAERVWVMDSGMVSEQNIAFLRERKARYLVGTPKSQLREL